MNRKNIMDYDWNFKGWFDLDSATLLAEQASGDPYTDYTDIYKTKGGKLVGHFSNNSGMTPVFRPVTAEFAVQLINSDGYEAGREWAIGSGAEAFDECEIK